MRQKLAKRLKMVSYGDNSPRARSYQLIPNKNGSRILVTDNLRAWYQREKRGWSERIHPSATPGKELKAKRKRANRRHKRTTKRWV